MENKYCFIFYVKYSNKAFLKICSLIKHLPVFEIVIAMTTTRALNILVKRAKTINKVWDESGETSIAKGIFFSWKWIVLREFLVDKRKFIFIKIWNLWILIKNYCISKWVPN